MLDGSEGVTIITTQHEGTTLHMGLFDFIFDPYTPSEKRLLKEYSDPLMARGIDRFTAWAMAKNVLDECIKASKEEGKYDENHNLGEVMLKIENKDATIKKMFLMLRKEGVRDEDILEWWNRSDVERRFFIACDNINKTYLCETRIKIGDSPEEAVSYARKYLPMYGKPEDTGFASGNDKLLPYELIGRINMYIQMRAISPDAYKKEFLRFSTFNAFIRQKIREGEI